MAKNLDFVEFYKINTEASMPERTTQGAAGFNLRWYIFYFKINSKFYKYIIKIK